jgi:hypothetical protein
MVIFGGVVGDGANVHGYADGAAYRADRDQWRLVSSAPIPGPASRAEGWVGRARAASAWTGAEVLVWGGQDLGATDGRGALDGALYEPGTDRWRVIPSSGLSQRDDVDAVWDGEHLLTWGGGGATDRNDGAMLDPTTMTWLAIPPAPLAGRIAAGLVWAGDRLLVWGGQSSAGPLSNGAAFFP